MSSAKFLLVVACVVVSVAAQCPDVQPKLPFDLPEFLGTWYGGEMLFEDAIQTPKFRCAQFEMSKADNGSLMVQMKAKSSDGEDIDMSGEAMQIDPSVPSRFNFTWAEQDYMLTVMATEYQTYGVVYGCGMSANNTMVDFGGILGRKRQLLATTTVYLKALMALMGVDISRMMPIDQKGC